MVVKLVTDLILFMKAVMIKIAQVHSVLNYSFIGDSILSRLICLDYTIFVFDLNCISVDCQWNDWTIGTCSATCGDGTRTNTRTEKVFAAYGGEECNGPASIQESCNIQMCPGMKTLLILYVIHSFVFLLLFSNII